MKKPPRAAWRSIRSRRARRWLRSYQRRFAHQMRQPVCCPIQAPYLVLTGRKLKPCWSHGPANVDFAPMSDLRGGIDLGGTKIQTAVIDPDGEVKGEARRPTPTEGTPADVAKAMAEAMVEAAQAAGIKSSDLQGIGVGSPGDVDEKTGAV